MKVKPSSPIPFALFERFSSKPFSFRCFLLALAVAMGGFLAAPAASAAAPAITGASPGSGLNIAGGDGITVAGSGFVQSGELTFTQVSDGSSGSAHACGIGSDSLAYCWGINNYGVLGNNSTVNRPVPVAVDTSGALAGLTIKQISVGANHTCVIASDDHAYCWGYNYYGHLGNNSTVQSSVPVAVDTSGALAGLTIKQISAGAGHTCAIASDNNAYCWGWNSNGQLGNNSTVNSPVPVTVNTSGVLAGKTIKQIVAGWQYTCAIASDDKAYCWGNGYSGQLGNNLATQSSIPVAVDTSGVLAGKTIKQLSGGQSAACVIASDNRAYCWGSDYYGQLGNNSNTNSLVPVAVDTSGVLNGVDLKQVSVSSEHACALDYDGKAYCWGQNNHGQLGNNSAIDSYVPVAVDASGVLAGLTIVQISEGGQSTCVMASNGKAYCWGSNSSGQLGNNSTTDSLVPVLVVAPIGYITPTVTVGGVAAANVVVSSDTQLTFTAPPRSPGVYDLVLDYGGGLTVTRPNALTYVGVIDSAAIGITAPVKNATPVTAATGCGPDFTCGAVTWSPAIGASGKFLGGTQYTATVELIANDYYTFTSGLTAHTINGSTATLVSNNGATATLSYTFAVTAAPVVGQVEVTTPPRLSYIDGQAFSLDGMVVTVTYDDGTIKTVTDNYAAAGIISSPVDGALLHVAQNGDPVMIDYDDGVTARSNIPVGGLKVTLKQAPANAAPVPALREWALLLLTLLLGSVVLARWRRA